MTRYFYTDPLAAAWMAKHFGMRFGIFERGKFNWEPIYYGGYWGPIKEGDSFFSENVEKFYIHPDSVKLLEPQVLDVAQETNKDDRKRVVQIASPVQASQISDEIKMGLGKIIQRNSITFMWPEVEPQEGKSHE